MALSLSNILIFQTNDGDGLDILRQTFSGSFKFCHIDEDNDQMVYVEIFNSTFSQPNVTYYGNFVTNSINNKPLVGINEKYWFFQPVLLEWKSCLKVLMV